MTDALRQVPVDQTPDLIGGRPGVENCAHAPVGVNFTLGAQAKRPQQHSVTFRMCVARILGRAAPGRKADQSSKRCHGQSSTIPTPRLAIQEAEHPSSQVPPWTARSSAELAEQPQDKIVQQCST